MHAHAHGLYGGRNRKWGYSKAGMSHRSAFGAGIVVVGVGVGVAVVVTVKTIVPLVW